MITSVVSTRGITRVRVGQRSVAPGAHSVSAVGGAGWRRGRVVVVGALPVVGPLALLLLVTASPLVGW